MFVRAQFLSTAARVNRRAAPQSVTAAQFRSVADQSGVKQVLAADVVSLLQHVRQICKQFHKHHDLLPGRLLTAGVEIVMRQGASTEAAIDVTNL